MDDLLNSKHQKTKTQLFWSELLIMIGIAILSAFVFTLIGYGLMMAFGGYTMNDFNAIMDLKNLTSKSRFALLFLNSMVLLGAFFFSVIVLCKSLNIPFNRYLSFNFNHPPKIYLWAILMFISALFLMEGLGYIMHLIPTDSAIGNWADKLEKNREIQEGALLNSDTSHWFWFLIIGIALVPALAEEFFFRGWFMHFIKRNSNWRFGLAISAISFALIHFNFYNIPAYLLIASAFGLVVLVTRNLLFSIFLHFANNSFAVYLNSHPALEKQLELSGDGTPNWFVFITSLLVFAFFVRLLYHYGVANKYLTNNI